MSDTFTVTYEIGGKVSLKTANLLAEAIENDGLGFDFESSSKKEITETINQCIDSNKPLEITGIDIPGGNTEKTDVICMQNKLSFTKRVDGKYEYNGEIHWWTPKMDKIQSWENTDINATEILMSADDLQKRLDSGKNLADVITEINTMIPTIPPLTNFRTKTKYSNQKSHE